MRIIEDWQYKYIERSLYNYVKLSSDLETERRMKDAITAALVFFNGTIHEQMIREFYFEANQNLNRFGTTNRFHEWVCIERLHTTKTNGYVVRREIIYRIAMNCFISKLFAG